MAKAGGKSTADDSSSSAPDDGATAPDQGESTAAYWKRILHERPRLINAKKANATLRQIWLDDHPGHAEVPANIIANLANVKTQLRNKRHKGKRRDAADHEPAPAQAAPVKTPARQRALESLEDRIDDCLMLARDLNRPELANVIDRLRRARNEVVVQIGE